VEMGGRVSKRSRKKINCSNPEKGERKNREYGEEEQKEADQMKGSVSHNKLGMERGHLSPYRFQGQIEGSS